MKSSTLGDVAGFVRGLTFKPEDVVPFGTEGSIVCFRTKNVQSELDVSDVISIPESLVKNQSKKINGGDIIVSSANSWNLVGKCSWVFDLPWNATFGGFVSVLRAKPDRVFPRFLYWWFSSPNVQAVVRNLGNKTTSISNLNIERCLALPIEIPSMDEQKRIAAILDKADALRAKRRKTLEQLDALAQAIFIEMFSTPTAQGWKEVPIELLASQESGAIRTGPFGSQLLHSEFTDEGVAVLGIDNAVQNEFAWGESRHVSMEKYKQLSRYTVKPGDVIITIMGTCGRCAVVPQNIPLAINTKHLCCITLDQAKCLPDFLHAYFLRHPLARGYLERTAKGAIMSGLNMGIIKSMPVKLPPLELQAEFVRRIEGIRKQKAIFQGHAKQLDALFSSLQHRAFRGEL